MKNLSHKEADTSWLDMLGEWNTEIASLYGKRLQECGMFPFSVMTCTSPDDLTDAQEKFSETLLADYRATAEKLMHAFGTQSRAGSEASDAYAAALLKAQDDARNILDQARAHAKRIIDEARASLPEVAMEETKAA
jgi:hypothetical protein